MPACWRIVVVALAAMLAAMPARAQTEPRTTGEVVVFAAASLKNALDDINEAWAKEAGAKAKISYAGSSALAKQIEQGAPAQVFLSADLAWMDYLAGKGLIKSATRTNLLGNRIVLVAPKASARPIEIEAGVDLGKALGDGRLAVANVAAVPAGKYAKAALEELGAWAAVEQRLAQAENVRAALLLVSRGEASLGIVYATDAAADPGVTIVGVFPETTHPPIIYRAATTTKSPAIAERFLRFLTMDKARKAFEANGFQVLVPSNS